MLKKVNIIIYIILILISGAFVLEQMEVFSFPDLSVKYIYFIIYIAITLILSGIILYSFFKISSIPPKEIVKIVYKDKEVEPENIENEEIEKQKRDELIIEKAMELTNNILSDLRDETNLEVYCDRLLINFSKNFDIVQGLVYVFDKSDEKFKTKGAYAFYSDEVFREFELGVGLTGQVAKNKDILLINNVPAQYIKILSGLGSSSPSYLTLIPVINEDNTVAVIELASFEKLSDELEKLFLHLSLEIGNDLSRFLN